MDWKRTLVYLTGTVDQELLLCNEYLLTEKRILRQRLQGCLRLTDPQRKTLAKIAKLLGRTFRSLDELNTSAREWRDEKPDEYLDRTRSNPTKSVSEFGSPPPGSSRGGRARGDLK